ncbi:hypothetical protein mRhiFer1_008420 [Rhinolophus ferrumequinum]|uniref:RNase H type-1 domain-containing protein n=1 Tax=Rhinolophus ferrumequinum TaxID=59479 RepID=A0A7J7V8C3_RHIFE|nr:hypothetical protein mRhiFer1_008420 [Rhinolophus ferrumequinum]
MQWIMSDPVSHKIGHAQEASIIKWKWYIQNRAKIGPAGILSLHELVIEAPITNDDFQPIAIERTESPVVYNRGCNSLSAEQKRHAWFTDGSARYIGNTRYWKAVAYDSVTKMVLETSGEGKSSQFAELQATYQAINFEKDGQCHIFTDSWAVDKGLGTWMPRWEKDCWKIYDQDLWGADIWKEIWEIAKTTNLSVFHVDAHAKKTSVECEYNADVDRLTAVAEVECSTPISEETLALAR